MLNKESLIEYIIQHNPNLKKDTLLKLSIESLVVIKVQLEIELSKLKKK
jgi:hypothetical protein